MKRYTLDESVHRMAADLTATEDSWYLVSPDKPAAREFLDRFRELYPQMCIELDPRRPTGKTTITVTETREGHYFAYAPGRFLTRPCRSEFEALKEALGYAARKGEG